MSSELKPCPFCQGGARVCEAFGQYRVQCKECLVLQNYYSDTPEGAAKKWNTRLHKWKDIKRERGDTAIDPLRAQLAGQIYAAALANSSEFYLTEAKAVQAADRLIAELKKEQKQ